MNALEIIIRNDINAHGPMPFSRFMELCLFHERYGYYNTHDPLRDFATAPEISQLFGEMIAVWCIDCWMKLGSPSSFTLLECGPGRGTLMADICRTAALVPDFIKAANVVLLEKSPLLKLKQQEALSKHDVTWINALSDLPQQKTIMVCNEFFDAFPVQPFVKTHHGWGERAVAVTEHELAYAVLKPEKKLQHHFIDALFSEAPIGAIAEINFAANDWVKDFAAHLKNYGGTALIIDYGYEGIELANTVQAIHQKRMSPVFKHVGEADITVHVDFAPFQTIAKDAGIQASSLIPMRDFLLSCGIETRAERLKAKASDEQQEAIDVGLKRLTASEQMGHLFKVLGLYYQTIAPPIGCEA
ncbi:MAG: SAM-dependent methyltransferase [Alphaproteobacteria bacterium]|nr:SAM-dependent methyltransferase [Alphaproteobacteria bacterium]